MTTSANDAWSRRDLLKFAAVCGVSFGLERLDLKAAERRGPERAKSLILLWMAGGPSQLETWDPHPGKKIGGETKAIKTAVPDLEIAEFYPQMAEQLPHLNVIRSLISKEGDHERGTYFLKTGYRPDPTVQHPHLGAILAYELPHENLQIPPHISIGPAIWPGRGGYLGDEYDAFKIFDPRQNVQNLATRTNEARQARRLANLNVLEEAFRSGRTAQTRKTLHRDTIRRALEMMGSEQLAAFRLDSEPEAIRKAYGENPFGQGCLVARRLVETGVRTVEVTLNGWDTHVNNYELNKGNAATLDPAFATLVKDLKDRDLLDSTLVVCLGEFGRTPNINPAGGRDHWPNGFSCVLGGGGLARGRVIGATNPDDPSKEPRDPIEVKDLFATLLDAVGVEYNKQLVTPIGRPLLLAAGHPIASLMPDT